MTPDDPREDARRRVRQLLLSGDNTIKNRDDDARLARARARFDEARRIAVQAGLDEVLPIIDVRLADLPAAEGDTA
ncbi:MAG: hypothetical protein IT200_01665 [Thermoleophilia bacterium]|nr:hypothetical protein [Thermoleophilia bacterium]